MARRRKKRDMKVELIGIIIIAVGIILALSIYFSSAGLVGNTMRKVLTGTFGIGAYVLPLATVVFGGYLALYGKKNIPTGQIIGISILFVAILAIVHLTVSDYVAGPFLDSIKKSYALGVESVKGGGAFAAIFAMPMRKLFGLIGAYVLFITISIICILIVANISVKKMRKELGASFKQYKKQRQQKRDMQPVDHTQELHAEAFEGYDNTTTTPFSEEGIFSSRESKRKKRLRIFDILADHESIESAGETLAASEEDIEFFPGIDNIARKHYMDIPKGSIRLFDEENTDDGTGYVHSSRENRTEEFLSSLETDYSTNEPPEREVMTFERDRPIRAARRRTEIEDTQPIAPVTRPTEAAGQYRMPPLSMLSRSDNKASKQRGNDSRTNANLLERTFENFGIEARVINTAVGPAITRYEVQPAPGVKVSRIVNLSDDIALSLAASSVRMEAPIPGKNAIGIEVPNKDRMMVPLRDVLDSEEFSQNKSKVAVGLGKDISGKNVIIDLAAMPHLMIAGATGSGKSVCINSLIVSLLYKATPEELQMIMIDPKVVELSVYNDIPHLRTPVVTDPRRAAGALNSAVAEMTKRYKLFAEEGARDIDKYNDVMAMTEREKIPYWVVIVDELADLMMVAPKDVEDAICRIAQMGRAAGIHLVIATQRPSVDVITGLIKANFPSRIAFAVSSQVDSRTILDQSGAEQLLGRGDMLFSTSSLPKPVRLQGAFVADPEVEAITSYIKERSAPPEYDEKLEEDMDKAQAGGDGASGFSEEDTDELLEEAILFSIDSERASTSQLQRRFRIGYGRAARIMDDMEEMGIISEPDGSRPRDILMTRMQYEQMYDPQEEKENDDSNN